MWQQSDRRYGTEYAGKAAHESEERATLDDVIPMDGLALNIQVKRIMSTTSDFLCYKY